MNPIQPTTQSPNQFYREERHWDQAKMRVVTKKIPCSFQEVLENFKEEQKQIAQNDLRRKSK